MRNPAPKVDIPKALSEEEAATRWFIFDIDSMHAYCTWVRQNFGETPLTIESPDEKNEYTEEQIYELTQTGVIQMIIDRRQQYIQEHQLTDDYNRWCKENLPLKR